MKKLLISFLLASSSLLSFGDKYGTYDLGAISIVSESSGSSYIKINQDLDSFTFKSTSWGNQQVYSGRVGASLTSADGKKTDLGYFSSVDSSFNAVDLKSGDTLSFYLNDLDGMYYKYSLETVTMADGSTETQINFDRAQFEETSQSGKGGTPGRGGPGDYGPGSSSSQTSSSGWTGSSWSSISSSQHGDDWLAGQFGFDVGTTGGPLPGALAVFILGGAGFGLTGIKKRISKKK